MCRTFKSLATKKTLERQLYIPDTHAPYHDKKAWAAMLKFAKQWEPDTIIHVGDWADNYSLSAHDKDPRRLKQTDEEWAEVRELREELDNLNPQRKILALGNHEFWLERHLMRAAPSLISTVNVDKLGRFTENGWVVIPYKEHGRAGRLHFTHEAGYSGVNALHQTAQAFGHNVIFGHAHRLGSHYFGDVLGNRYVAACLGWLGDIPSAKYATEAQKRFWSHGFGVGVMNATGQVEVQLKPIVDGRLISRL